MFVFAESSSAVLVMMSSKHVIICNCSSMLEKSMAIKQQFSLV